MPSALGLDLRYALRGIRRSPTFAAAVVTSLLLGVGVNLATFDLSEALLLRPLPYAAAGELLSLQDPRRTPEGHFFTYAEYERVARDARGFSRLAAFRSGMRRRYGLRLNSVDQSVAGVAVTPNTFGLLGVRAAAGRLLVPGDERHAGARPVVIGYAVWRRSFGGRRDAVGTAVQVDGVPHVIVGVAPRGFWFPFEDDAFWVPLAPAAAAADGRNVSVVGRVRAGVPLARARAEAAVLGTRLDAESGARTPRWWRAVTLDEARRASDAPFFFVLQGVTLCVLLLACANVSNLHIARALARARDGSLRLALGASSWALVRSSAAEGLMLSAAAVVAGAAASYHAVRLVAASAGRADVRDLLLAGGFNVRLAAYVLLTAVVTAGVCAVVPAAQLRRRDPAAVLREVAGGGGGVRARRRQSLLLVAQLVLSFALLAAAGAFTRYFWQERAWRPSVDTRGLAAMDVRTPPEAGPDVGRGLVTRLLQRLQAVPGVRSAAASEVVVPDGGSISARDGTTAECSCRAVTRDYLATLGVGVTRGRGFVEGDVPGAVVVEEALARALWGTADPIGQLVRLGDGASERPWGSVVGVVPRLELTRPPRGELAPPPSLLVLGTLDSARAPALVVRGGADAAGVRALRAAVLEVDPRQEAYRLELVDAALERAVAPLRWFAAVVGALAGIAVLLSAVGLHGLVAQRVAQRRHELGVRLALGARPRDVVVLVVAESARLVVVGLAVGLAAAAAGMRLVAHGVEEVRAFDPLLLGGIAVFLAAVGLAAALLPAVRAAGAAPRDVLLRA